MTRDGTRVSAFMQLCGRCARLIERGHVIARGPHGWCHAACVPAALLAESPRTRRAARRALARKEARTR